MRTPTRLIVALAAVAGPALYGANTANAQSINLSACSSLTVSGTTLTCVSTGGGGNTGATAPSCVVTVNPPSGAAGTQVNVSASCTGSPSSYSWTGGFMQGTQGPTANSGFGNPQASQTYTVTASNSAGSSVPASNSFTVQQSTGGGGNTGGGNTGGGNTGGGVGNCSTFGSTVTLPARSGVRAFSSGSGSFGNGTALVVQFTTGSNSGVGHIATVEFNGQPTPRTGVLAATSCDFGPQQSIYATSVAMAPTVYFTVGPNSEGYPQLSPNTTYFFNLENKNGGSDTCSSGDCPMSIDLTLP